MRIGKPESFLNPPKDNVPIGIQCLLGTLIIMRKNIFGESPEMTKTKFSETAFTEGSVRVVVSIRLGMPSRPR